MRRLKNGVSMFQRIVCIWQTAHTLNEMHLHSALSLGSLQTNADFMIKLTYILLQQIPSYLQYTHLTVVLLMDSPVHTILF